MSGYQNVVCCIEDSEPSMKALDHARRIVDGTLTLLHVLPPEPLPLSPVMGYVPPAPELRPSVEQWIDGLAREGEKWVVLEGHAASAAVEWAEANAADLIVAARHRGFIDRLLLGSFAGYAAQHAPCDLLLVPA